ncbi:MAG: hypothetical protein CVU42_00200 [Chloroflexi bacterium HGW-Chloroflexi-4]|nr:MAG: hypothetical protein CVU42_00200 [Chloroflexi bacterium HGW-Chloroflexi-4]
MNLKDFAHRIKLTINLFLKLKHQFRVEVEDFFPDTWFSTCLNHYYFNEFSEAQKFIKKYNKPFYLIRLVKQVGNESRLCNIETEQTTFYESIDVFDHQKDKYGYSIPVPLSSGWYRRGENIHNPIWTKAQEDLPYLMEESFRRYVVAGCVYPLDEIIKTLMQERHPNAPDIFQKNVKMQLVAWMKKNAQRTSAK